jgi:hypothetical protein
MGFRSHLLFGILFISLLLPGLNGFEFFFDSMREVKDFGSKREMRLSLKKLEFLKGKINLMIL